MACFLKNGKLGQTDGSPLELKMMILEARNGLKLGIPHIMYLKTVDKEVRPDLALEYTNRSAKPPYD